MSSLIKKSKQGEQSQVDKCSGCYDEVCTGCDTEYGDQLYRAMMAALGKIDILTNRVKSLEKVLEKQSNRRGNFEINSGDESEGKPDKSSKCNRSKASKTNRKLNRKEFKDRQHMGREKM